MQPPPRIPPTRVLCTAAAAGLFALPATANAHVGTVPYPHDLWTTWSFEPAVLVGILLASWSYARGLRAVWQRAGRGHGIPAWRAGCFAAGSIALVIALVSPVDGVSAALFSVHMVQHLLLVMIAFLYGLVRRRFSAAAAFVGCVFGLSLYLSNTNDTITSYYQGTITSCIAQASMMRSLHSISG